MYALFEERIEQAGIEYTDEFKEELNKRYDYYKSGGKMITAEEANARIEKIIQKG